MWLKINEEMEIQYSENYVGAPKHITNPSRKLAAQYVLYTSMAAMVYGTWQMMIIILGL